jgi:hypothetical protein
MLFPTPPTQQHAQFAEKEGVTHGNLRILSVNWPLCGRYLYHDAGNNQGDKFA